MINSRILIKKDSWYPNSLIELDNGDIILTAKAEGCGTLLYTKSNTPIGTIFYERNQIDLLIIKRVIREEILITFNI